MRVVLSMMLLMALPTVSNAASADDWNATAKLHAQQGQQAATLFPGYASLCDLTSPVQDINALPARRPTSANSTTSAGSERPRPVRQPIPPMQVFDNLYFLGNHTVTAWLYGTADGYLLIDGLNTDQEAQTYILDGMKALGLDPKQIKHVLITHAHGDHYGGADFIARTIGVDLMMSAEDWQLAEKTPDHPRFGPAPKAGTSLRDGQRISFGQSSLSVHLTPGHTAGTLSLIFDVYDQGKPHRAVLWGGTGFNFGSNPERFQQYAAAADKMEFLSKAAGVDVFLSNHVRRDRANVLMTQLHQRKSGEAHPFVFGEAGYALFHVLKHCALAQAARVSAAKPR